MEEGVSVNKKATDISNLKLSVDEFYQAVEGSITRKRIGPKTAGRHSDCLVYVIDGKMRYTFDDGSIIEVAAGDVLFLACGSVYSMYNLSSVYSFIFVDFMFSPVVGIEKKSMFYHMQNVRNVETMFRRMLEKWRLQKPAAREDCISLIYSVYAEIIRNQSVVYVTVSKRRQIDLAIQYISENFTNEALSVEKVAEHATMSESHFRRVFKSVYRVSPVKYINMLRINRAKELIRYSGAAFSQIAAETGFSNLYYFSRVFKKEVGCTPSEYKEAYGEYQGT